MKSITLTKRILCGIVAVILLCCIGCGEASDKSDGTTDTDTATDTLTDTENLTTIEEEDECTSIPPVTYIPGSTHTYAKPVIYLYPERELVLSVKLTYDGVLTTTYPEYTANGWQNVTAHPDGRLEYNGREYYCLYWEGVSRKLPDITAGACVRGTDTAEYLEYALAELGLTEREANEFIIYWLPQLECNEYNIISFLGEEYSDIARLDITPAPDSILRVYMVAKPCDKYTHVKSQSLRPFTREGFCVVEWGGTILDK